jgi:hypothetical protein
LRRRTEIFREGVQSPKIPSDRLPLGTAAAAGVSFLFQTGEPQTKALNHHRYSRGPATTS